MPGDHLAKNKYVQQSLFAKEKPKRRSAKRKKEISEMLANIKEKSGCIDCGGKFPYYLLDFDHVRGTKVSSISRMLDKHPLEDIFKEIDKCEIVVLIVTEIEHFTGNIIDNFEIKIFQN